MMKTKRLVAISGLSPLARGTRYQSSSAERLCRFIPAGAGNTALLICTISTCPVYPRWRGEHLRNRSDQALICGLSPLARGTPTSPRCWLNAARFIPAGAGNTISRCSPVVVPSVYPRWRGEHFCNKEISFGDPGLSPLARGTR